MPIHEWIMDRDQVIGRLKALEERVEKLESCEQKREEIARKAKEEVDKWNEEYLKNHPNTLPSIRRAMGKPVCECGVPKARGWVG